MGRTPRPWKETLVAKKTREEIEAALQAEFATQNPRMFQSTAEDVERSDAVQAVLLDRSQRARMPLTRDKFVIDEPPARIEWERVVREFLMDLPDREAGHRVTAPMVYEWATGRSIAEDAKAEGADQKSSRGGGQNGSANSHLRHINWVLREYFGKSYETRIAGRRVGKAYNVRQYFRVEEKEPANITLWPDWKSGTLDVNPRPRR